MLAWIPYVGSVLGSLLVVLVAATDFPEVPTRAYSATALFVFVRLLDDFVYVPITVGRKLRMHPLGTVVMIFAGGAVAGIVVKRSPQQLPDVPTFAEAGLAGVESYGWYGFFAPAKTPKHVITKINDAALKFMKTPEFQKVLADTGSDYVGDTPENFAAFVKSKATKWGRVAKETGATLD